MQADWGCETCGLHAALAFEAGKTSPNYLPRAHCCLPHPTGAGPAAALSLPGRSALTRLGGRHSSFRLRPLPRPSCEPRRLLTAPRCVSACSSSVLQLSGWVSMRSPIRRPSAPSSVQPLLCGVIVTLARVCQLSQQYAVQLQGQPRKQPSARAGTLCEGVIFSQRGLHQPLQLTRGRLRTGCRTRATPTTHQGWPRQSVHRSAPTRALSRRPPVDRHGRSLMP